MKLYERIFNIIGWIGFLALAPVVLSIFGVTGPQLWLEARLGYWGGMEFLTYVFFGITIIRVIFGSGETISPLIIGFVVSFLLIVTAVPVGFMAWFRDSVTSLSWFMNIRLNLVTGLAVLALGILLSRLKRFHIALQLLVLVVLPVALLVLNSIYSFIPF